MSYVSMVLLCSARDDNLIPIQLQRQLLSALQHGLVAPRPAAFAEHGWSVAFTTDPSQICDVWKYGVLHPHYPANPRLLSISHPPLQHRQWWIDDITIPCATDWWTDPRNATLTGANTGATVWIACYDGSPVFTGAAARGVT
jgi:hypothetical protein